MISEIWQAFNTAAALKTVRSLLAPSYSELAIRTWLTVPCARLGFETPLERILDGFGDMVIDEARRLAS